ncbi:PAS domain-containing sensor histidine kinase [Brevundimonas sp. S30B]|uniref:sensor histidine kinase NtrY-like n=1 Tax=unclassified Brevundimonas TaxID=2622653 RepID=UPI001072E0ED|nr:MULTISPECIES: PAS domain-containing sensor histidine kinase [unclassified Brevundimonas]QBX37906.1 PAS domain-containing sensor histidine kinase [Brevundimonas sp. MF30-B]TFW02739.1 PAS domain-containing sensor histidine kinase [Brevundimonas sp. S30B]
MTDTPAPLADVPAADDRPWLGRLASGPARNALMTAYALAVLITAAGIWLVVAAPGAAGGGAQAVASQAVLVVLACNLVLIGGVALLVGARVLRLAQRRADPGARLHLRFVTIFSLVAVAPAILVALVFGVLVNRGVDQWFSQNVQAAVENGADIGRAYISDVSGKMDADLATIGEQLTSARPLFDNRIQFSDALVQAAEIFGYPAIYILNSEGQVLARGETPGAPPYLAPPRSAIEAAAEGGAPPQEVTENPDVVRSVSALPAYGDAFLYLVRPLEPGLVGQMRNSVESIQAYREAEVSRARIQAAFALSYLETVLLVLVGAVWLGMSAASAISGPIGRLVRAADQVASGDLTARVDSTGAPGELALLSQAFNRMTGDLQDQQAALKAASDEAQGRSRFIETVLSGVSAGVIGLDRKGRISAINDSAVQLLAIADTALQGRSLAEVSPELSELVRRAEAHIEEDIDVSRDGDTRRLRVRIEGGLGGEMVLTFDDITRLVTAQRNAAWRDVARRIAHEIKNPLTPIQLSAERLRRKYRGQVEEVEVFDRCTETIIRQVGDIGRMVDEFSAFARMPAPRFALENPAELMRQAVFAQRVAAPDVGVELAEPLPETLVSCDGRMLGQALANILKNAGEAVTARRAAHGMTFDRATPGIIASLAIQDGQACFTVEDDGLGLPEKDRDRLTEPYVTTREKGTGLGLAIVKRICEDHGGELKLADAETLNGARVRLVVPLNPTGRAATRDRAAAAE